MINLKFTKKRLFIFLSVLICYVVISEYSICGNIFFYKDDSSVDRGRVCTESECHSPVINLFIYFKNIVDINNDNTCSKKEYCDDLMYMTENSGLIYFSEEDERICPPYECDSFLNNDSVDMPGGGHMEGSFGYSCNWN